MPDLLNNPIENITGLSGETRGYLNEFLTCLMEDDDSAELAILARCFNGKITTDVVNITWQEVLPLIFQEVRENNSIFSIPQSIGQKLYRHLQLIHVKTWYKDIKLRFNGLNTYSKIGEIIYSIPGDEVSLCAHFGVLDEQTYKEEYTSTPTSFTLINNQILFKETSR